MGGAVEITGRLNGTGGTLTTKSGELKLSYTGADGNTIKLLDGSMGSNAAGRLRLAKDVKATVVGQIWGRSAASIVLEENAEFTGTEDFITFSSKGAADEATLLCSSNDGEYGLDKSEWTLTNGHAKSTRTADVTLSNKLVNSSVENAGGGTLTVSNTANSLTGVVVSGGNITLQSAGETQSLQVLKLAAGKTVNAYVGSGEEAMVTLSVTSSAVLSGTATLNSSLPLTAGSEPDMTDLELGAVALNGSLTFGGKVTLGDNLLSIVEVMSSGSEESVTLFTGLGSVSLQGLTELKDSDKVLASEVFTNVDNDRLYITYQMINNAGSLMMVLIPESATATLSLLALAALAARRRRNQ